MHGYKHGELTENIYRYTTGYVKEATEEEYSAPCRLRCRSLTPNEHQIPHLIFDGGKRQCGQQVRLPKG